jgi:hypothetical protein
MQKCKLHSDRRSLPTQLIYISLRRTDKNYQVQRLILGTHTNDEESNYLQIAEVQVPTDTQELDTRKYEESTNGKS